MAIYYIASHGNDNNDGLSWKRPFKTLKRREDINGATLYISGYFESFNISYNYYRYTMYGYDKAIVNGLNEYDNIETRGSYYNIEFYNFDRTPSFNYGEVSNCYFHDINVLTITSATHYTVINNITSFNPGSWIKDTSYNNTIHNCKILSFGNGAIYDSIISNCNISMTRLHYIENTLIVNCSFKFTGGVYNTDEIDYIYPQGETDIDKLYSLRYRVATVYGGNPEDYFINCIYYSGSYNDIFVNANAGDFNLITDIADNLSHNGSYVGAKQRGINISNLTFSNINGTSGYIIDDTLDAYIESDIIDLGDILEIKDININSIIAYKDGHQINLEHNLGNIIDPGNNVLEHNMNYVTLNDIIEQNDTYYTHYKEFETFNAQYDLNYSTSGTSGSVGNGLGYTTYDNGLVQEVFYTKSFSKYKLIVSDDDETLTNGIELNMLYGNKPTINADENNKPIYGNADLNYSDFNKSSLLTRYIKILIEIKTNNLKVRL